jgi:hypothetical protein
MLEKNSATDQTNNKKRYVFVQKEGDDFTCIKIVEGKFENVIYKYGKVGFAKDENLDGTLPMKFDYDILSNPNKADIDSKEFIDYVGDILMEQLEKQIKDGTVVFDK